jgi:hypothetical protein
VVLSREFHAGFSEALSCLKSFSYLFEWSDISALVEWFGLTGIPVSNMQCLHGGNEGAYRRRVFRGLIFGCRRSR